MNYCSLVLQAQLYRLDKTANRAKLRYKIYFYIVIKLFLIYKWSVNKYKYYIYIFVR